MSRRTLTLAVAGFLVVLLSAVAALLPVPYVALEAGPVTNTLGSVGKTQLIRIDGRETYPVSGNLDLTTVHVLGGPGSQLGLVTALRGWLDDGIAIVPEDTVYPPGETAKEAEKESAAEMRDSQENATTAALHELGIPVEITSFVQDVPAGSPSAKTWCFQIGTRDLSSSISARQATNASPRWAQDTATTTARSPTARSPTRCTAATATTSWAAATSSVTVRSSSRAVGCAE